jgi:hypothetical protein
MPRKRTAVPGTLIHGTLNPESLLPALARELEWYTAEDRTTEESKLLGEIGTLLAVGGSELQTDYADEVLSALFDAFQPFAPPGHSFSAHPGDGSDFGFWPNDEE